MLWKQLNPRYRRLLKRGDRGEALVVNAKADTSRSSSAGIFGWSVTIRVTYPDGSTADFDRYVEAKSANDISAGMILPIRFDPSKRSRVEIDTEALRAQSDAEFGQAPAASDSFADSFVEGAEREVDPLGMESQLPGD
jgi:hypothetical protein